MSLLLLIDGYNVVSPVAPPSHNTDSNWLHRERMQLIKRLSKFLPTHVRSRTCIVFDASKPPRNRSSEFAIDEIHVRFAIDYPEADDLIEEIIRAHHSPKQLMVVSSDHRIQAAARRRNAKHFDSQPWLDRLVDGDVRLAIDLKTGAGQGTASNDKPQIIDKQSVQEWVETFSVDEKNPSEEATDASVQEWMREFGFDDD